jgi:hypothetical protein
MNVRVPPRFSGNFWKCPQMNFLGTFGEIGKKERFL